MEFEYWSHDGSMRSRTVACAAQAINILKTIKILQNLYEYCNSGDTVKANYIHCQPKWCFLLDKLKGNFISFIKNCYLCN